MWPEAGVLLDGTVAGSSQRRQVESAAVLRRGSFVRLRGAGAVLPFISSSLYAVCVTRMTPCNVATCQHIQQAVRLHSLPGCSGRPAQQHVGKDVGKLQEHLHISLE